MIKKIIIANLISYGIIIAATIAATPILVKHSVRVTEKLIDNMEDEN